MEEIITYHDNGSIKEKYYVDNNNQKNGMYITYWSNGKIFSKTNYINGKLNGLSIKYLKNGIIEFKKNYINDKLIGIQTNYKNNKITKQKYHL